MAHFGSLAAFVCALTFLVAPTLNADVDNHHDGGSHDSNHDDVNGGESEGAFEVLPAAPYDIPPLVTPEQATLFPEKQATTENDSHTVPPRSAEPETTSHVVNEESRPPPEDATTNKGGAHITDETSLMTTEDEEDMKDSSLILVAAGLPASRATEPSSSRTTEFLEGSGDMPEPEEHDTSPTSASPTPTVVTITASTPEHSTPVHSTPAHSTPVHSTPVHSTPVHSTPAHSTPAHSTPAHSTPAHSTPAHGTPAHSTPARDVLASGCSERLCEEIYEAGIVATPTTLKAAEGSNFEFVCSQTRAGGNDSHWFKLRWDVTPEAGLSEKQTGGTGRARALFGQANGEGTANYTCSPDLPTGCCDPGKVGATVVLVVYVAPTYVAHIFVVSALTVAGVAFCIFIHLRKRKTYAPVATKEPRGWELKNVS
ncbi:mucin-1 [Ixodes scapularis]|uniref:mucin-1 n=1 Tax=Ixodes scapularis TaxID=6945 RepID=UPI001AD65669|nr:mucin-1 [Ixodes scapularis]